MTQTLELTLSTDSIERQCLELASQARSAATHLGALIALQSCIAAHTPPGNRNTPAYRSIQAIFEQHAASAREQLMMETALTLHLALVEQDSRPILHAHAALSRNGFWQAVALAADRTEQMHLNQALNWLTTWCAEEKSRAQEASPYPDCLDFRLSGIDPDEYSAMEEARRALVAAT